MNPQINLLLKKHSLRTTPIRQAVLGAFLASDNALSHSEVEQLFKGKFDRITVYRTLKSFEEKGLVHEVIDDKAVVKYAACQDACDTHQHHDDHIHFKCTDCEATYCINHVKIDVPSLPKGFQLADYQLLVRGTCPKCS